MQAQDPHQQMPVRQSPCEAARGGQGVLTGRQRQPLSCGAPKPGRGQVVRLQMGQWGVSNGGVDCLPGVWVKSGKSHWLDTYVGDEFLCKHGIGCLCLQEQSKKCHGSSTSLKSDHSCPLHFSTHVGLAN